jgi:dolichyl-phosphate beta-glucosyltransferase
MKIDRFSFDVEFLYLAKKIGLKISETPVEWHNVLESRVRIVQDSLGMLRDLFQIKINDFLGKYN